MQGCGEVCWPQQDVFLLKLGITFGGFVYLTDNRELQAVGAGEFRLFTSLQLWRQTWHGGLLYRMVGLKTGTGYLLF